VKLHTKAYIKALLKIKLDTLNVVGHFDVALQQKTSIFLFRVWVYIACVPTLRANKVITTFGKPH